MTDDELMAAMYHRLKRVSDGSLSEAVKHHSQVCGLIAYLFDVHPDTVAHAVAVAYGSPLAPTE